MIDLDRTHITFGQFSDTIYIAVGKEHNGRFVASRKVDRTFEFLAIMVEFCGIGHEREIESSDGRIIVVTMKEKADD